MNLSMSEQYWPFLVLVVWFGYKAWRSKRVAARLPEFRQNNAVFIHVRSAGEFAMGNAPGSINIPLPEIGSRIHELPNDKDIVLFCASGTRSGMAALLLRQKGFSKVHNAGTWTNVMNH